MRHLLCFALAAALAAAATSAPAAESDREALARILKENPQLIMEVLKEHRVELYQIVLQGSNEHRRRQWRQQVAKALTQPIAPKVDPARPIKGPEDARYTIVEYSDFLCGACRQGTGNLMELMKRRPGQVRVLMKHYYDDELGKDLAVYFEAVGRQDADQAWEFARRLFADQKRLRENKLAMAQEVAQDMGLDMKRLMGDLADPELTKRVEADLAEAQGFKLKSTPSFVINGVPIAGAAPVGALEEVLEMWSRHQKKARKGGKQ